MNKRRTEMLSIIGIWVKVSYTSVEGIKKAHPQTTFVTDTNEHNYYATNSKYEMLFRIKKSKSMTKKEAEQKYDIRIVN